MDFLDIPVRVRVPATSANLGPGFDTLGLALGLYDDLTARVIDSGLTVTARGEGAENIPVDESHLVIRAMRVTFELLGAQPPGLALKCRNRIPHARGLGSSAAAIVAGVVLARALCDAPPDDDETVRWAAEIEGHPDNVAACVLGGLTVAWTPEGGGDATAIRLDVDPRVIPVVFIPPTTVSTKQARDALPQEVPHFDAVFNTARSALLVAALTGAPQHLLTATDDRLHQPYRAASMNDSSDLVFTLRERNVPAAISGAGPAVLVLARDELEAARARAHAPEEWRVAIMAVDADGATVLD